RDDGSRLVDQEEFKRRLADAEQQLLVVEQYILQALAAFSADREIGAAANAIKIRRGEVEQTVTELGVMAAGYSANPINVPALRDGWNGEPVGAEYFNPLVPNYMFFRAASIYSGTNEIQHNVIAKA